MARLAEKYALPGTFVKLSDRHIKQALLQHAPLGISRHSFRSAETTATANH